MTYTEMHRNWHGYMQIRPADPSKELGWVNQVVTNYNELVRLTFLPEAERNARLLPICASCQKAQPFPFDLLPYAIEFAEKWYDKLLHT